MRFVLLAFVLIGVALFLANPRSFGVGYGVELSEGKSLARVTPRLNLSKIGDFGAEMVDVVIVASSRAAESYAASGNQVYRTVKQPPTYPEQLRAIALALSVEPEETAVSMYDATEACLGESGIEAAPQMVNYFSGLVQVVAITAELPEAEKAEQFVALSAPLTVSLKAWLQFMSESERAENALLLESWAAQPKALVACHLDWLNLRQ